MREPYKDLLLDAVGFVAPDGAISPENRAMQILLRRLQMMQLPANLLQLPRTPDEQEELRAFLRSERPRWEAAWCLPAAGDELYLRLRLQASGDPVGHWVVMRDETLERKTQARANRLDRLRHIGQMGEGIVHDLNNLLGAVMGLADHMRGETGDAELQRFLHEMVRGTQQRAQILRSVHQVLRAGRRGVERSSLSGLLGDAVEVFKKTAMHQDRSFELELAEDLPDVRAVPDDVMHYCLFFLSRALQTGEGAIRLVVDEAPGPGALRRNCGRLRIFEDGDPAEARGLMELLAQDSPGFGAMGRYQLEDEVVAVFSVILRLRLHGAEFELESTEGGRVVWALYLPAAARRER